MNKQQPPGNALRFLRWFCREDYLEEIEGDLTELFEKDIAHAKPNAGRRFFWRVVRYFRPAFIKSFPTLFPIRSFDMLKSYGKVGWRNLYRYKVYSSIKIGGFAVGIAACLLIFLFVRHESSYDTDYAHQGHIFRVYRTSEFRGELHHGVHFPAPFAEALQRDYPEVERVGRYDATEIFGAGANEVRRLDQSESFHEEGVVFADQELLDILEFKFVAGDPATALGEPNTVVITEAKAAKYFGQEDPIGKALVLNNDEQKSYTITGVLKNLPATFHLKSFDIFISLKDLDFYQGESTNWRNSNHVTYVRLRKGANPQALAQKMSAMLTTYFLPYAEANDGNKEEKDWVKSLAFSFQPVSEIYINDIDVHEGIPHGDIRFIWLFSAIAVFILIIACINFINLSTAKSANRAREVGLRKVVGSLRGSLIRQFLTESVIYSFFSFLMGLLLASLLLPFFNDLIARQLIFPWRAWWLLPAFVGGVLTVGLVAGLYPAFYLSTFRPVEVLKGNMSRGARNPALRSTLVVFQFTISIVLVIATFVVSRQMDYIMNKKLGFDKDRVLVLQGTHTLNDKIDLFKRELLDVPGVSAATISGYLPVAGSRRNGGPAKLAGMTEEEEISSQHWSVDYDYLKTMGLRLVKGRDFSPDIASDSQAMIINETLARSLPVDDPIGVEVFNWLGGFRVIGVVEDFHFDHMKDEIRPLTLFIRNNPTAISVKISTEDIPGAIARVTKVWRKFSPNQSIRYTFLDQQFTHMYDEVLRVRKIFGGFAVLAIVVSCLGLFALSAFMIEQRNKEISIRLVLGATVQNIFGLLTSNFVRLVIVSIAVATPLAWYLMQAWLEDYAYKISLGWDVFAWAGALALITTFLTVSFQSVRAALAKPVDNLRSI